MNTGALLFCGVNSSSSQSPCVRPLAPASTSLPTPSWSVPNEGAGSCAGSMGWSTPTGGDLAASSDSTSVSTPPKNAIVAPALFPASFSEPPESLGSGAAAATPSDSSARIGLVCSATYSPGGTIVIDASGLVSSAGGGVGRGSVAARPPSLGMSGPGLGSAFRISVSSSSIASTSG